MSWNPVNDAKKAARKVVDKIIKPAESAAKNAVRSAANGATSTVRKIGNEVEGTVKKVGHEVESGIKSVGNEIEDGLRTAASEIEKTFEERLPELVEDAIEEAIGAIAGGALNKAVDIIQVAAPDSMELKVGPICLSIEDVKSRIDTFQRWASNPPTSNDDMREMIETLSPTSVSVEVAFSLALLVVQSDSLECGFTMSWNTQSFLDKFEDILGKI